MILYSGAEVVGRPSSDATVEDAEEPGVRNVFDSSERRVSGLQIRILRRWGGTFLRIEIGRGLRVPSLRRVVTCNDPPFYELDNERRSLWEVVPSNPFYDQYCQIQSI